MLCLFIIAAYLPVLPNGTVYEYSAPRVPVAINTGYYSKGYSSQPYSKRNHSVHRSSAPVYSIVRRQVRVHFYQMRTLNSQSKSKVALCLTKYHTMMTYPLVN